MKFKEISESTTSGSIATVSAPLGKTQKRAGSLFKGKKTNKPFYEDEIVEQDLILVPGQVTKKDKSFIPHDQDRTDHEVEMARSDLYQAAKNAQEVYKMIEHVSEDDGLEGWVQEKIIKANDYLNTVREYLEHKMIMKEGGGVIAGGMSNFEEGVAEGVAGDPYAFGDDDYMDIIQGMIDDNRRNMSPSRKPRVLAATKRYIEKNGGVFDPDVFEYAYDQIVEFSRGIDESQGVAEGKCPKCGGPAFSEEAIAEAKDACYHKVKSRYKVWPSAYASGALVKCRKVGASNWGNKSKK